MAKIRIEQTIVGVLESLNDEQGKPIGTGFVVAPELVVTAYHVVQNAMGLSKEASISPRHSIWLTFPQSSGSRRRAFLLPEYSRADEDIAMLRVQNIPSAAKVIPLGSHLQSEGRPFVSMGYRAPAGAAFGIISGIELRAGSLPPRLMLTSDQLSRGMSGAPVVDIGSRRVVGMVVSIWMTHDPLQRDEKTALAVTSTRIHELNPELTVKPTLELPPELLLPIIVAIELGAHAPKLWGQCKKFYHDVRQHWKEKFNNDVEAEFDDDGVDLNQSVTTTSKDIDIDDDDGDSDDFL